ncbi:hypothetical protein ACZ11_22755 [Lysinibacillus xylanilyticus]|uniref:Uncharacterized protein n=1 Tax=Lysinibacillus xylanilyticus TaxID=582475 RepID=A0A0K9F210_9BACI|nr:hypothetical protein ACZ11_22755 [Lysinibacillus xylanilyticus]
MEIILEDARGIRRINQPGDFFRENKKSGAHLPLIKQKTPSKSVLLWRLLRDKDVPSKSHRFGT